MAKTRAEANAELAAMNARIDAVLATKPTIQPGRTPSTSDVFGVPTIRKGEDPLASRGFSIIRTINALKAAQKRGLVDDAWCNAKVEREVIGLLEGDFKRECGIGFNVDYNLIPFATALLPDDIKNDQQFGMRIKSLMQAGVEGFDPDEARHLENRVYSEQRIRLKDTPMSWLDQTLGGALVGPPAFGELIDLLRNTEALIQAGATVIPLPQSGRIQFPRQTSVTLGYYVGENTAITDSRIGTGTLTLSAKKVAARTLVPNELLRHANPMAEALIRMDMIKTLRLRMDYELLQGLGSDISPLGLINTPNINALTASTAATDGDTMAASDIYEFDIAVEANNANMEAFIMRPKMFWKLLERRAGAANATDSGGQFLFSMTRGMNDAMGVRTINGHKVITSNQVSGSVAKGSGTTLTTVFGGMFSDYLMAIFGALEFAVATQGDTMFTNDQTMLRAILHHDGAARHPGAFAYMTSLLQA